MLTCGVLGRLWQSQLQRSCPAWIASGVAPDVSKPGKQTWKDLVTVASQAQIMECFEHTLAAPELLSLRTQQLWNSGKPAANSLICFHLDLLLHLL